MNDLNRPPQNEERPEWSDWFFKLYEKIKKLCEDFALMLLPSFTGSTRGDAGTPGRLIYNSDDDVIQYDNGSSWNTLSIGGGSTGFKQLVTFTSSGTYTPSTDVVKIKVIVVGGGGGGGSARVLASSSEDSAGGAGAGGGVAIKWYEVDDLSSPITVTVGSGGSGGANYPTAGSTGGTTSFNGSLSATGGGGGSSSNRYSGTGFAGGGTRGVGSGGDINMDGDDARHSRIITGVSLVSSDSGGNMFAGSINAKSGSSDGDNGEFPGGGATGGANFSNTSAGYSGGDGAAGVVWIEEYYS